MAQNLSGVPARAHNFEDAFSLEEFSSTTLPVVWTATGGNPRLSITDITADDQLDPLGHLHCAESSAIGCSINAVSSPSTSVEPSTHLHQIDCQQDGMRRPPDRPRQQDGADNPSSSKAITLTNDLRRPSFWSFLTHPRNYQHNRVRARIQTSEEIDRRKEFASSPGFRKCKFDATARRQQSDSKCLEKHAISDHDSSPKMSLLRKLVNKLERRSTCNLAVSTAMPPVSDDCEDGFISTTRDRPVRMRSKWSSAESGAKKLNVFSNRRSKSNFSAVASSSHKQDDGAMLVQRKDSQKFNDDDNHAQNNVVPDDQYLRFMTAVK